VVVYGGGGGHGGLGGVALRKKRRDWIFWMAFSHGRLGIDGSTGVMYDFLEGCEHSRARSSEVEECKCLFFDDILVLWKHIQSDQLARYALNIILIISFHERGPKHAFGRSNEMPCYFKKESVKHFKHQTRERSKVRLEREVKDFSGKR
jgi:hypothetical protein